VTDRQTDRHTTLLVGNNRPHLRKYCDAIHIGLYQYLWCPHRGIAVTVVHPVRLMNGHQLSDQASLQYVEVGRLFGRRRRTVLGCESATIITRPHRSRTCVLHMRLIVTDRVAWSVGRSVCRSVTVVNPAKTVESIEMPFGLRTRVGPRNRVLDGVPDPP